MEERGSSSLEVLRDADDTEGCYGVLVSVESSKVPYNADEHVDDVIRIYSKEMVHVYLKQDSDYLVINGSRSQNVKVPQGMAMLEASTSSLSS